MLIQGQGRGLKVQQRAQSILRIDPPIGVILVKIKILKNTQKIAKLPGASYSILVLILVQAACKW
jgi:hypothetical protein